MIMLGIKQFGDPYYQGFAAQIAFFIMLSLVPTIILLTQILGILDISLKFLSDLIDQYVSDKVAGGLKGILDSRSTIGNNIFLIILAIWSSSRAQFALMRITNYTYSGGRTTGNFFKERLRSLKTMFLTILTIGFTVIIMVYGQVILDLLIGSVIDRSILTTLWSYLKWPLAAGLYFLVMLYQYYTLPITKLPVKSVMPGAIAASAGIVIVTFFYSMYARVVVSFGLLYGSLASIVALLTWFYLLSWVIVLGILFNKVWMDTKES